MVYMVHLLERNCKVPKVPISDRFEEKDIFSLRSFVRAGLEIDLEVDNSGNPHF